MKKTIKMILVAILVLVFCIPSAFAQKIDAPEHVNEVCYSKSGKITVTIDADVYVPEIDRIPIYGAELRLFELEELLAMADAAFGERKYFGDTQFQYEFWNFEMGSLFDNENYSIEIKEAVDPGEKPFRFYGYNRINLELGHVDSAANFYMPQIDYETTFFVNEVFDIRLPDSLPRGCDLSYDEARRICDEAVARFAPDYACVGQAITKGEIMVEGEMPDEAHRRPEDEAWVLYYTCALDMPVTYSIWGPSSNLESKYAHAANDGLIRIVVNDSGIQEMDYRNPHKITGVLQEDCELLSFEQIMDVAWAILPLTKTYLEQHYDDIRINIYDIRFGYMRVISRDTLRYEYIPVWDFFGTQECRETRDGEVCTSQEYPFYSYLTISAIDGTVIDRTYGY